VDNTTSATGTRGKREQEGKGDLRAEKERPRRKPERCG